MEGRRTGQAKISELDATVSGYKNAGRANAAVDDTALAKVNHAQRVTLCVRSFQGSKRKERGLHRAQQLRCHVENKPLVNGLAGAPELLYDVCKRTLRSVNRTEKH